MARILTSIALTVLAAVAGLFGYQSIEGDLERERLQSQVDLLTEEALELRREYDGLKVEHEDLLIEHDALTVQYNDAVARTAVTELLVEGGRLAVVIRDQTGVRRTIETPFNPEAEIYVDYAVLDGRLWIRRVFDDQTPPSSGVLIDPEVEGLDWADPGLKVGKAVYRRLTEGRWVVTVSGDGSLGLRPAEGPADLADRPSVGDFEPQPMR